MTVVNRAWLFLALTAAVFLAAPAAAQAQSDAAPVNWLVNCTNTGQDGALACQMTQTVVVRETGQRLLSIMIRKGETPTTPAMMLTLPLGLYLPAGVKMSIDEAAAQDLVVQTCEASGCFAGMAITEDLLDAMRRGTKLDFVLQDLQRRSITVSSSLSGFTSAFEQINE
ncbi:MAG: invasion associated locus B family protein [Pseudomonadota bacterium]